MRAHAAVRESRKGKNGPDEPPSETAAVACESASTTWSFALLSNSAILQRLQSEVTRGERARSRVSENSGRESRGTAHNAAAALARARHTDTLKCSDSTFLLMRGEDQKSGRWRESDKSHERELIKVLKRFTER